MTSEKKVDRRGSKKPKPPLAERLKRAAQGAGFTSETLSERLGVTAGAVRSWWVGRNEPSVEMLRSYAAATEVSVTELISIKGKAAPTEDLEEMLLRWARMARQRGGTGALREVRGDEGGLSVEEQAMLDSLAPQMISLLNQMAGSEWEALEPPRQREVLAQLVEDLQVWRERQPG